MRRREPADGPLILAHAITLLPQYEEEEYQKEIEEYIEVMDGPADRRAVAAGGYR